MTVSVSLSRTSKRDERRPMKFVWWNWWIVRPTLALFYFLVIFVGIFLSFFILVCICREHAQSKYIDFVIFCKNKFVKTHTIALNAVHRKMNIISFQFRSCAQCTQFCFFFFLLFVLRILFVCRPFISVLRKISKCFLRKFLVRLLFDKNFKLFCSE